MINEGELELIASLELYEETTLDTDREDLIDALIEQRRVDYRRDWFAYIEHWG